MILDDWIPVFPLPNVVLFPRAVLPLHIFEPRYRVMAQDAIEGPCLITMALLKPGYEPKYHSLDAAIHPVVCVGAILRDERLPDGRYNILLQGRVRARIMEENTDLAYRRARLQAIPAEELTPETERFLRAELRDVFNTPPVLELASQANWLELLKCPELGLSDSLDLLASVALQTVEEKQAFLSESRVEARMKLLRLALGSLAADYLESGHRVSRGPRCWPPECLTN